jgi:hypothetical protein
VGAKKVYMPIVIRDWNRFRVERLEKGGHLRL